MTEWFHGRCRTCLYSVQSTDKEKRDWLLARHHHQTRHTRFRTWTEDYYAIGEVRGHEERG